jgi:hypothetical protein
MKISYHKLNVTSYTYTSFQIASMTPYHQNINQWITELSPSMHQSQN